MKYFQKVPTDTELQTHSFSDLPHDHAARSFQLGDQLPVILKPFLNPFCSTANIHPMMPPMGARGSREYPTVSGMVLMAV